MLNRIAVLHSKMDYLRQKPHVFEVITTHSGVRNLQDIESLSPKALNRLQQYVDYYYNIITSPSL